MAGRRAHPEDDIQRAIFAHIKARGAHDLVAFHVPNGAKLGGARSKRGIVIQAARLKGLGVLPGVSDWILLHAGTFFALEVKAEGNVPTSDQLDFIERVNGAGGYAAWAQGLDRCLRILEQWGCLTGSAQLGSAA